MELKPEDFEKGPPTESGWYAKKDIAELEAPIYDGPVDIVLLTDSMRDESMKMHTIHGNTYTPLSQVRESLWAPIELPSSEDLEKYIG